MTTSAPSAPLLRAHERYRPQEWPTGGGPAGWGFWVDFHAVPPSVAGWNARRVQTYYHEGRTVSLSRLACGQAAVTLTIFEAASYAGAHEALLGILALSMAPMVRYGERRVGDVCFTNDGEAVATLAFARDNLAAVVASAASAPAPVVEIAAALDRAMTGSHEPGKVPGPLIEVFSIPARARVEESVPVNFVVRGRPGSEAGSRLRSTAGSFDRVSGQVRLTCRAPGSHAVTLAAVDSAGNASSAALEMAVE